MAKFEYKREEYILEAYGKEYPIPTKTAVLVDGINGINKELTNCKNTAEIVVVTIKGIALFIGENEAERIFPAEKINEIDTDELSAFWLALNAEANKATNKVVEKYSPKSIIRTK